ncbi:MAG: hypothetical protein SH820_02690, partial [Xanthomonadales bacterium]|nr:hypothetical protein [Xanthomonadales bacterium]
MAELMREQANGSVRVHPPIQALSQWVENTFRNIQWLRGHATNRRADPHQLAQVWQRAWPDPDGRLSDNEKHIAARQAIAAERLIQQWNPNAFEEAGEAGQALSGSGPWLDSRFFTARQTVKRQQASSNWSTAEDTTAQLIGLLENGVVLPFSLPTQISCRGFHEWTHLEQCLLTALQRRGVEVVSSAAAEPLPTAQHELHSYASPEHELQAAAQWAKQRAQTMELQGSSGQIVVVIHGLNQSPSLAARIFEKTFCSEHEFFIADRASADFYLPYGEPLSASPLIQDALMLLQLAHGGSRKPIAFPTISRLLLSPAWANAAEERNSRARLELDLRQHSAYYISLSSLLEQARRHKTSDELTQCIDVIREAMNTDWQEPGSLELCLRCWGWPGSGSASADVAALNSLVSRFSSLLERAQNLDDCSLPERLNALRRMCAEAEQGSFGGPLSRVLLLTPEDAVGQRFDAAWVVGLHAGN